MPLAGFIRYCRVARNHAAKVVTDQDLTDIHAFLRSRPKPPAVDSVLPREKD